MRSVIIEITRENEVLNQRRLNLDMTQEEAVEKAQVDLPLYMKIENGDVDICSAEFYIVNYILSVLMLNISDYYYRRPHILNGEVVKCDDFHELFTLG